MWDLETRVSKTIITESVIRHHEGVLRPVHVEQPISRSFSRGTLRPKRVRVKTIVYNYEGVEIQAQPSCSSPVL